MRISDWSSDVCSSDLRGEQHPVDLDELVVAELAPVPDQAGRRPGAFRGRENVDATIHRAVQRMSVSGGGGEVREDGALGGDHVPRGSAGQGLLLPAERRTLSRPSEHSRAHNLESSRFELPANGPRMSSLHEEK